MPPMIFLLLLVVFAGLGTFVSAAKNRAILEGLVLGGLFGPLGVIIAALLPTRPPASPPACRDPGDDPIAELNHRDVFYGPDRIEPAEIDRILGS